MAGAGDVCAHVGALLFTAEGNTEMKRRQSCTLLPWIPPRHQFVPAIKVAEIDFKTPKSKQLSRSQSHESDATPSCKVHLYWRGVAVTALCVSSTSSNIKDGSFSTLCLFIACLLLKSSSLATILDFTGLST